MENITIGQIVGVIGTITVIVGFIGMVYKWYEKAIVNKLKVVNDEIIIIKKRLDYVESKRDEYEEVAENSKFERQILMSGLLSALKGLESIVPNEYVSNSIKEIEEYMMKKSHD